MKKIRIGHSPDSDDAFMFWGLATGAVQSDYDFEHILRDIQTLNEWAMEGKLESTAVSVHALAYVTDKYALLPFGGSFGENYGPMIIAKRPLSSEKLFKTKIAIPGKLTSAFLALYLYYADLFNDNNPVNKISYEVVPFDEIIPAVQKGQYDAGLIIHEGQLTYKKDGLILIEDLGKWWGKKTGLPLPLGVNLVRKDLGEKVSAEIARCIKESIQQGLNKRKKALEHALKYARGMDMATSDEFVGMYVNQRTLNMGEDGFRSIQLLLKEGMEKGIVPAHELERLSLSS